MFTCLATPCFLLDSFLGVGCIPCPERHLLSRQHAFIGTTFWLHSYGLPILGTAGTWTESRDIYVGLIKFTVAVKTSDLHFLPGICSLEWQHHIYVQFCCLHGVATFEKFPKTLNLPPNTGL